jgi:hypothetical protein
VPQADYRYLLDADAEIVVSMETERGEVANYSVVLLALVDGEWRTVRVYDSHLGTPHMHRYTREGVKRDGEKTGEAMPSDGYNMALERVKNGFREMIDGWKR